MAVAIPAWVAYASLAVSAVSAVAAANRQASAQGQANAANARLANDELTREQTETNRVAAEQMTDRMRKAAEDLAQIRVASADGAGFGDRAASAEAYMEGLDISRIENNRKARDAQLQSQKVAASTGAYFGDMIASNQAKAASESAFLGTIGSGIKIASDNDYQQKRLDLLKHKV